MIDYHHGKANMVADALSQKSLFSLRVLKASLTLEHDGSILDELRVKPVFLMRIQEFKKKWSKLVIRA